VAPLAQTIVAAGGQITISVEFHPTTRGPATGTVEVRSNDPQHGSLTVTLSGRGIAPDIQLSWPSQPGELNFGQVEIGQTSPVQKIIVANGGDDVLNINSITSLAPEFSVGAYQRTLPPNGRQEVDISFTPAGVGVTTGQIRIESDDPGPGKSLLFVPLRGEGYKRPITVTPSRWKAGGSTRVAVEVPDPLPEKIHVHCDGATMYMIKKVAPKIFSAIANIKVSRAKKIYPLLISNGENGEKIGSVDIEVV
jgi:hypothetical protein